MPPVTTSDRPAARTAASAPAAKPRATKAAAATKTPKKGKVVRRTATTPADGKAATAKNNNNSNNNSVNANAAPANMRELSKRNVTTVCDAVSVASRFESQSRCSAVAPDTTVWTGEADGSIVIRLAPSGVEVSRIKQVGRSTVLVLANVAGRMWAGFSDGAIRVYEHDTQKVVRESTQHTAAVYAMCAADGFVYTGGADWKVYQWEADDLHFCRMYHGHRNNVRCLTTYRDPESGRRYVVSGSDDGTVKIWDSTVVTAATTPMKKSGAAAGEREVGCVATLDGQGRGVLSALALEDTAELWVGSEDTAIRVWDLYSMTITSVITAHRTPVVTLQRVEETIWSGSKDGTIVITNRFSKDVVHHATQPPTSSSTGASQQRFNMSIQPVTRTVVYNVWATSADGSWQCWHFTAPEGSAPCSEEAVVYPEGHYLSQSRNRRSAHTSQRRSHSARAAAPEIAMNASSHGKNGSALTGEDAELRESVARTRRSVAVLLTEPAEVTINGHKQIHSEERDAAAANAEDGSDAEDVPIDAVAESIRNDHTAETRREVEQQRAALEKEVKRAERLRAQLEKMGQDPAVVVPPEVEAEAEPRRTSIVESPNTEALDNVSLKLEALKAENAAMKAAIQAAHEQEL